LPIVTDNEGITFQMVIDTIAKTEKLKIGKASYYPVTILKKTFKAPITQCYITWSLLSDEVLKVDTTRTMKKDAKGKFYISGGDVDVSSVWKGITVAAQISDGKVDPSGSMIIPITIAEKNKVYLPSGGKIAESGFTQTFMWTTGQSSIIAKGSKGGLEGKTLPDDDTSGLLPKPLVGIPLDLNAGNGTLVSTSGYRDSANAQILRGSIWKMKITPATSNSTTSKPFSPITFTGSGVNTTEPFTVNTKEWMIDWSYKGDSSTVFSFYVYPRGETVNFVEAVSSEQTNSDSTYMSFGPGDYYIKVISTSPKWTITIRPR
jgi:hypothetical protein